MNANKSQVNIYEHMCGLSGFRVGRDGMYDVCPACTYDYYKGQGDSDALAVLKVERDKLEEYMHHDKNAKMTYTERFESLCREINSFKEPQQEIKGETREPEKPQIPLTMLPGYRRHFDRQIFFGGLKAKEDTELVRDLLENSFDILSGIQQPGHYESEEKAKVGEAEVSQAEKDLIKIREDIFVALGGKLEHPVSIEKETIEEWCKKVGTAFRKDLIEMLNSKGLLQIATSRQILKESREKDASIVKEISNLSDCLDELKEIALKLLKEVKINSTMPEELDLRIKTRDKILQLSNGVKD